MRNIFSLLCLLFFNSPSAAQIIEYLGLADSHITSIKIGEGLIAVGTNYNGVFYQSIHEPSYTGWEKIDIDSVHVTSVYPHKSGPLSWSIGIGTEPNIDNPEFLFCSFMGGTPKPMSYGIDKNHTASILGIDGFPDESICGETFAIGGRKLYRRFFRDTTWHSVYDLTIEGYFASLQVYDNKPFVYAGGSEGFAGSLLIRSTNNGDTWDNLFPLCNVQDIDFYGDSIHKIIVTDRSKVLLSKDHGSNWSNIFQTDSLMLLNIAFSPSGIIIYIAANTLYYGLPRTYFFYSKDEGNSWQSLQLPIYDILAGMDLTWDNWIYLAFISSGVFRFDLPVVKVDEEIKSEFPEGFNLYQNYPNPFNPSTKIRYTVPCVGARCIVPVELKVYDVLGNEIATLVNEYKPAGSYEVEFSVNGGSFTKGKSINLTTGLYFYVLKTSNYISTKKMIYLK
ncbi:MAG: hypothetical protein HXY50_02845 [Ignavibacteriaceae bacterium]|nr:hypothetical protein [Ignavibacteriaceae bacterium]